MVFYDQIEYNSFTEKGCKGASSQKDLMLRFVQYTRKIYMLHNEKKEVNYSHLTLEELSKKLADFRKNLEDSQSTEEHISQVESQGGCAIVPIYMRNSIMRYYKEQIKQIETEIQRRDIPNPLNAGIHVTTSP